MPMGPDSRQGRMVRVGAVLERVLRPTIRKRGVSATSLMMNWDAAVGAEFSHWTRPVRVVRDSLHIEVASAWAPLVQHEVPRILERINTFLGKDAIKRIAIRHGQVRPPLHVVPGPAVAPDPVRVTGIADPDLRATLGRLGGAIRERERERQRNAAQ